MGDSIIGGITVPRETRLRLEAFASEVLAENRNQNLISKASESTIWERHIADSAQLLGFAPLHSANWLDLGSGAGFPGLVIAMVRDGPVTLVEARPKRAAFLQKQVAKFSLDNVTIFSGKLERLPHLAASVISARAFAPLARLLPLATRFSTAKTCWILPKGKSAAEELESVRGAWHGDFRIEQSLTDPQCGIIVATDVRRKGVTA